MTEIKIRVQGVLADPERDEQIVILKGESGNSILPVWISVPEGNAIRLGLEGIVPERPMSHDLLVIMLEMLKLKLDKVVLDELSSDAFSAKLHLTRGEEQFLMDAVPGDAIALSLRANSPLFVPESLMKKNSARNLDEWLTNLKHTRGPNEYDA